MGTPRSLRGAMKRGWFPVEIKHEQRLQKDVSHLGLSIWADRNCREKFICAYIQCSISAFVFEDAVDAFIFECRWS